MFANDIFFFPINYKMSPAGSCQCLVNVLGRAAVLQCLGGGGGGGGCGGVIGRDPRGLAMRRTEAALSPGCLLVRLQS